MALQLPSHEGAAKSGWLPLLAAVPGEEESGLTRGNLYLQLRDYVGGDGTKPDDHVGEYLSPAGMVAAQAQATNIAQFTGLQLQAYLRGQGLHVSENAIRIVDELPANPDPETIYYVRGGGDAPFVTLAEVIAGTGTDERRVNAQGLNEIVRGFGPSQAAVYRHNGLINLFSGYPIRDVYGPADDRSARSNSNQWRKFVAGGLDWSSGLDGIEWHSGARNNVDYEIGEEAGSDLIDNTVFSLEGVWRVRCSITLDNLHDGANNRIVLVMRQVVDGSDEDDTVFFAEGGEGTQSLTIFGDHEGTVSVDNLLRDRTVTISLETPWDRFIGSVKHYLSWRLANADSGFHSTADFRMRHSYLQFERWGS